MNPIQWMADFGLWLLETIVSVAITFIGALLVAMGAVDDVTWNDLENMILTQGPQIVSQARGALNYVAYSDVVVTAWTAWLIILPLGLGWRAAWWAYHKFWGSAA